MILFIISFLLVFTTSYFITCLLVDDKFVNGIFYLLLSAFANVVLTMEILSLFSAISVVGVLILNVLFLILSIVIWCKKGKPVWKIPFENIKSFFRKYLVCINQDKYFAVLSFGFLVAVGTALFMSSFMPIMNLDAESYHALRSLFWIHNHNLNHFYIADIRNIVFPINSEIVYAWVFMFIKRSAWIMYTAFEGFILAMCGIYNILSLLKFSMRKKLWVIFITCSLSSVIAQITSTETDMIIAGLILSAIYLFWYGLKSKRIIPIFMSSLAYALAAGTKTTALITVPGCAIGFLALAYYYDKKEYYKPILKFIGFGILNFIIFSSYNYVLNFLDFGNIFGSKYVLASHGNFYGLKAVPANFIKYIFMFVDFAGFRWNQYLAGHIENVRNAFLAIFNLSGFRDGFYSTEGNRLTLVEPVMGLGVIGLIVYLPYWIFSLLRPIFKKDKRSLFIFCFGLLLVINLLFMSLQLAYMSYSIRFLMGFCVISAPILAYSYCKRNNFYKFIVVLFSMFYMCLVSTHLYSRPIAKIIGYFKAGYTIQQIREIGQCSIYVFLNTLSPSDKQFYKNLCASESCMLKNYIRKNLDKNNKIIFFANTPERLLLVKMLDFEGYSIDFGTVENIENIDLNKYNIAIFEDKSNTTTNIKQFENRKFDVFVNSNNELVDNTKSGNYCVYSRYNDEIVTANSNADKVPFLGICYYTDNYLADRFNYKYLTTYTVNLNFGKNTNLEKDKTQLIWNYRFFENLSNPVIK